MGFQSRPSLNELHSTDGPFLESFMRQILFIDRLSPVPYTLESLQKKGAGASDSYLVYLAKALTEAMSGQCQVWIAHGARNHTETCPTHPIQYVPFRDLNVPDTIDAVIIQRDPEMVPWVRQQFPNAQVALWMSDFAEKSHLVRMPRDILARLDVPIIGLSEWHADNLRSYFNAIGLPKRVDYIYYPIDVAPDPYLAVDPNKLVFFSSPHKGLRTTLQAFLAVRQRLPHMRLYIGNPGYVDLDLSGFGDSIVQLGTLSRTEVLQHVQQALGVFHINTRYPETFGCIHAEANAVGTPVITLDIGANGEVIHPAAEQVLTDPTPQDIVDRVVAWRKGERPRVSCSPTFHPQHIAAQWMQHLGLKRPRRAFRVASK